MGTDVQARNLEIDISSPSFSMAEFTVTHGFRELGKHEGIPHKLADKVCTRLSNAELNPQTIPAEDSISIFFSSHPSTVKTACKLEQIARYSGASKPRAAAILRLGRLLGYPDCCIQRFLNYQTNHDEVILTNLSDFAGPDWPWQLNFFPGNNAPVGYFPCGPNCSHSLNHANQIIDYLESHGAARQVKNLQNHLQTAIIWCRGNQFTRFPVVSREGDSIHLESSETSQPSPPPPDERDHPNHSQPNQFDSIQWVMAAKTISLSATAGEMKKHDGTSITLTKAQLQFFQTHLMIFK